MSTATGKPKTGAAPGWWGPADPVKALLERHRELCARAADPLEIAAGLEAHGVTDRAAVGFRHRDVFSLAEELYARAPREGRRPNGVPDRGRGAAGGDVGGVRAAGRRAIRLLALGRYLLPAAGCAALATAVAALFDDPVPVRAAAALAATPHRFAAALAAALLGAVIAAVGIRLCLRTGPLGGEGAHRPFAGPLWTVWLILYALFGDALLRELLAGGPDAPLPLVTRSLPAASATAVGLCLALAPASCCARWYDRRVRRRLSTSRRLEEYTARIRPLLTVALGVFLVAGWGALMVSDALFGGPLRASGSLPAALALGSLLFLARLLALHGRSGAAVRALMAAAALEAAALCSILAARLPDLERVGKPLERLVAAYGATALPLLACATAAAVLLVRNTAVPPRAMPHSAEPQLHEPL
ncbi:hypothetical protein [Streptomyces sp. TP-A0874]|uniref:hypothetical protein n=1 Tax=Streptomyces sp. TP-A0874 TaxID=549819 RepID=UPI0008533296|nr:hypothetical protein [Streptomyces sp. TP-A0874]